MSPRTDQQYELIRENKKQLIMDTALRLFANEGFHTTSISKIAKEANIAKGLIYNYFESKEDLLKEIFYKGMDELLGSFDENRDGVLTDGEFEFMVHEIFRIIKEKTQYWKLYFAMLMQPSCLKLVGDKFYEKLMPIHQLMVDYFGRKGMEEPELEARYFLPLLDGIAFHYLIDPDHYPLEGMKKLIINRFCRNHKNQSS